MKSLSYSTLRLVFEAPHLYVNKISGMPMPKNEMFEKGKQIHRLIQDHISGKQLHLGLTHIDKQFPVVEEVDFDKNCFIQMPFNSEYDIIGFVDGRSTDWSETVEIKTGNYSLGKFYGSMQRKIYNTARREIKKNYLITADSNDSVWTDTKPKIYEISVEKSEYDQALQWITEGIYIIKHISDFVERELEKTNGKCIDDYCIWGHACMFK